MPVKNIIFIYNLKKESGVSADILKVVGENKGMTFVEIICERGLPTNVTFQDMITVLAYEGIDPLFKKYVFSKAQSTAKTDEDFKALGQFGELLKQDTPNGQVTSLNLNNGSTKQTKGSYVPLKIAQEVKNLSESLVSVTSEAYRKEVTKKLDDIICGLLDEAKNHPEKLLEVYKLILPTKSRRIAFIKQRLTKLGVKNLATV